MSEPEGLHRELRTYIFGEIDPHGREQGTAIMRTVLRKATELQQPDYDVTGERTYIADQEPPGTDYPSAGQIIEGMARGAEIFTRNSLELGLWAAEKVLSPFKQMVTRKSNNDRQV